MLKQIVKTLMLLFFALLIINAQSFHEDGCRVIRQNVFTKISPPSVYSERTALSKVATSNFVVVESLSYPLPTYQRQALDYAVEIWSYLINTSSSTQQIKIFAEWKDLGNAETLAECGPTSYYNNFLSAPYQNFQYPIALAEAITNQNLNGTENEISLTINSNTGINWYYGTDGIPQQDKVDLVSVLLHELMHGLGFIGSMNVVNGIGSFGVISFPVNTANIFPKIFDKYGVVGPNYQTSDRLINYEQNSTSLAQKLLSGNIYFDGFNTYFVNGNKCAKLYVPSEWLEGSSFSHLDDDTYPAGNSNSLITSATNTAEVIHSPGEIGISMLEDIGWNVNRVITITDPTAESAYSKGQTYNIKWTDNKGGSLNINLYKLVNGTLTFDRTLLAKTANKGSDSYLWTVPSGSSDVPVGQYRIKFESGGIAWGLSSIFSITDQQQVATPDITPKSGTYTSQQNVTITCATSGVEIHYTLDGSEPTITSNLYASSFNVMPPRTIKAKAYKSGWLSSTTAAEIYQYLDNGITLLQKDANGNSFGSIDIWSPYGYWVTVPSGTVNGKRTPVEYRALQDFKSGTYEKYNYWQNNLSNKFYLNWIGFYNLTNVTELVAQFNNSSLATIQNSLEGTSVLNGGTIEFKDPWLTDYNEAPLGLRNRGTSAPFKSRTSPFSPDYATSYSGDVHKGVFTGQQIVVGQAYYSVRAQSTQTINSYTSYFQNWSATNATLQNVNAAESGVVFNSANAVVTANYKGHLISNSTSGFNTNSQRKIVRTTDGQHHLIYESMGYVWYTRSTDGGTTWSQEVKINWLGINSKNASIAVYGTDVYIAYQSDEPYDQCIRLVKYVNGSQIWSLQAYKLAAPKYGIKPVVAAFENLVCVVYKPTSTSSLEAVKFLGDGTKGTNYAISNTDANSTNPTLAASNQRFCLAYQNSTTQIRYLELSPELNSTLVFEYQVLSTGSPYTNNTEPSISAFGSGPIISWNGYNTSIPTAVVKRRENTAWSGFSSFGNSTVRYTNNNSISDGTTSSIIAWCDIYNAHKFVKLASGTYSSILSLPESGGNGQIQISNGSGFADMKAVVYKSPSSGIYPVKYVSYNFQTLQKMDADQNMNYGRTAVVQKEKKNFVYYLGGIKVDGEKIKFNDYIDTLKIENEEMMNNIMTTETFYLTPKSEVEFSNSYYAFDNDEYKKIKENDAAFSIELVKLNGKELKGEFNPSKFEIAEITDDESFYKLDCSKIEEGYYYFRVNNKVNGTAEYFVNDVMYEDTPELNKKSFAELQTAENAIPNNYSLDNNYPNPFNPTTTITFAIPQQEYVSLKVYDVLGKEVATLVNGIKSSGKYSVSFNGRDLASGIYFYTLKAGNFSQTNKMMLVK